MRVWVALALLATGCLFERAAEPHFFRPASAALEEARLASSGGGGVPLRLQPVQGTSLLRERIVWRMSAVEYGLYEQRRWTELPASFVERALESTLRRNPGIELTGSAGTATLRVEVVAFEEVLAPAHVAAVSLAVSLRDRERHHLLDRTFGAEAPIVSEEPTAMALAMGAALDAVVAEVAGAVEDALGAR